MFQDGLASQVIGQSAVGSPDRELSVDACLNHLLLPGDGDVPRGKLVKKLSVLVLQLNAFNCGEGPNVIDVLGVNGLRIWHKRGRKDPCGAMTQEGAVINQHIITFIPLYFSYLLLSEHSNSHCISCCVLQPFPHVFYITSLSLFFSLHCDLAPL